VEFLEARDHELRLAHRLAFLKISRARSAADSRAAVNQAVEELIDACAAYTLAR
jgi:hypothetical protein